MNKLLGVLLMASPVLMVADLASAQEAECSDELDAREADEGDGFSLQCQKEDSEYATVQCAFPVDDRVVSCEYTVSDPGDVCAVSVACDLLFLDDDDEIVDQAYFEEGEGEVTGPTVKMRLECGCSEWR